MKKIKGSITRLIKSIKEKLPDEEDIFGFAGINKEGICSTLLESYNLLSELEKRKETFEVTLLKRKISELLQDASDFLNNQLGTDQTPTKFNGFLTRIANIKYHIKATYLLVVEDSIRSEARIIELKRDLSSLEDLLIDFETKKAKIEEASLKSENMLSAIESFHEGISEKHTEILDVSETTASEAEEIRGELQESRKNSANINAIFQQMTSHETTYKGSVTRFNKLHSGLKNLSEKMEVTNKETASQLEKNSTLQDEIQEVIGNANRASMAGSFKARESEFATRIRNAEWTMNITLVVIAVISGLLLWFSGLGRGNFDYLAYLSKMTMVAPLVWIAWSSSKKLGNLIRISEDYAFKYASAMAYEGYKRQTNEQDPELTRKLLATSIENMGMNPIRLFDSKNNHASPANEAVNLIAKKVNKTVASVTSKEG